MSSVNNNIGGGFASGGGENANPLLPDTISVLPFDHKGSSIPFTFCLNDAITEECYSNQPKLYNVLKAFDPSNYEGTFVNDLPEGVTLEDLEEDLEEEEDLEVEEDFLEGREKWKKWNKIIPGRFIECDALPDEDYEDENTSVYVILMEPLMDVDGTFVGIQSMEDWCWGGKTKVWANIEWLLDWCYPWSLEEGNALFQAPDENKFHYMANDDNPIYHRSFSVLNLDGIKKSSKEEEDGTLKLTKKDSSDDEITLFTYTDLFYVDQPKHSSHDDLLMLDLHDFKLRKHPIPNHLGIDLSKYGYQVSNHLSFQDDAVTMIDSKYRLYELYNNTDSASNFPPTYGTIQQALDDTTSEGDAGDEQVFYVKHCCDARGRGIGLYKRPVLQKYLDETKANYKKGYVEDVDEEEEDDVDEDIQLLKDYLTTHLHYDDNGYYIKDDIGEEYKEADGEYVVQKAVHDLYTLDYGPLKNRRFDIRFYVIIARGKVYMHANGHMKWVIGDFEFDPLDTTLHKQVSNIAVYGGGDTARFVFPYEVDGNDSWKTRRNMKKKPSPKTSDSSRFDPYGWRDAVSQALDKAAPAVFEHARLITEQDPNKYVMMGGDAVIRENGEASIIEFNVWPDVDKFGRFNNCLGNDKSNCRRFVMLEHDTYGMNMNQEEESVVKEEDDRPGYFVTDLNIITDVISSEGLARVMRDMAILVTGIRPAEDIVGLREIGSQFVVEEDDE